MSLATTKQMLLDARAGQYAVGAFNAENLEMVKAILGAAVELHAPVILQSIPVTVDPKEYGGAGIEKVKELVKEKMLILGCDGKA